MVASIRAASLIALAWASLLVYLAGCGSGSDSATTDGGGSSAGPIRLQSGGGYPPFTSTITIDEDGGASLVSESFDQDRTTTTFEIPADEVAGIRERLDDLDLSSLDVPAPGECCDLVYYELTYGDVTVETDISTVPDDLGQVITDINELKAGGNPTSDAEPR